MSPRLAQIEPQLSSGRQLRTKDYLSALLGRATGGNILRVESAIPGAPIWSQCELDQVRSHTADSQRSATGVSEEGACGTANLTNLFRVEAAEYLLHFIDYIDNLQVESYLGIRRTDNDILYQLLRQPVAHRTKKPLVKLPVKLPHLPQLLTYALLLGNQRLLADSRLTFNTLCDDSVDPSAPANLIMSRYIGSGKHGMVYHRPGTPFAIKAAGPKHHDALWSNFVAHYHVYRAFHMQMPHLRCRVPKVFAYVNYHATRPRPKDEENFSTSKSLVMEHILPLPAVVRDALVVKFCPPALQDSALADRKNRDCLLHLHLSRWDPATEPSSSHFSLRDITLCLNQLIDLSLPIDEYAGLMGEALAVLHWEANMDGRGVKFVLGCAADQPYKDYNCKLGPTPDHLRSLKPHTKMEVMHIDTLATPKLAQRPINICMWILGFGRCTHFDDPTDPETSQALINHLVEVFFANDPDMPRPLHDDNGGDNHLWENFSERYTFQSQEIMKAKGRGRGGKAGPRQLPGLFLKSCVKKQTQTVRIHLEEERLRREQRAEAEAQDRKDEIDEGVQELVYHMDVRELVDDLVEMATDLVGQELALAEDNPIANEVEHAEPDGEVVAGSKPALEEEVPAPTAVANSEPTVKEEPLRVRLLKTKHEKRNAKAPVWEHRESTSEVNVAVEEVGLPDEQYATTALERYHKTRADRTRGIITSEGRRSPALADPSIVDLADELVPAEPPLFHSPERRPPMPRRRSRSVPPRPSAYVPAKRAEISERVRDAYYFHETAEYWRSVQVPFLDTAPVRLPIVPENLSPPSEQSPAETAPITLLATDREPLYVQVAARWPLQGNNYPGKSSSLRQRLMF